MTFLKAILAVLVVVSVLFFLLGLKSQKGAPKGLVNGKLSPCGSAPNCVSSESETQPERKVAPLSGNLTQARLAIQATGGTIISETDRYISATYMSNIFKFVDDVEVRDAGEGILHIRSSSRVGYSDRGVNRRRVEAIQDNM